MSRTPLVNREIGWLSFNERVLQEAADPEVPLIERLKFVGICSSNLEEFFRVRVATLQRMVDAGISSHKMVYGEPKKVLHSIHEIVLAQRERFEIVFAQARAALEQEGISIVDEKKLVGDHRAFVQRYFDEVVRPSLAPVILDGEILVTASPNLRHQRIIVLLTVLLEPFVTANGIGRLLIAPFDVRFRTSRVFQPDLLVMTLADIESGRRDSARELRLAVEVVSPSSARYDRVDKRSRYQEERVEELWLVDPESELVERWRPDDERPEILAKTLIWQPVGSDASLSIDLVALFEESKR